MNKPVAWMRESDKDCVSDKAKNELLEEEGKDWNYVIPLYTHPHPDNLGLALSIIDQQKLEIEALRKADLTQKSLCKAELTDEEIRECIHQIDPNKTDMFMSFAKAILRKAQEK